MIQPIDRTSPVPLYYQLKQILLEKIRKGDWHAGELIPSENQLQDDYDVSRTTVRQTLSELVTEGFLVRQRGRGTFIADPQITYDPTKQVELNEYMREQGVTLRWQLMDMSWVDADESIASTLHCAEDAQVMRIRRLRLADNRIIGYHIAYLTASIAPYVDQNLLETGQSLDYLIAHPGLREPRIQRTLEATIADRLDIDWLDAAPNTPILQVKRVAYGSDNKPIEYLIGRFRGDRFKYQISF